MLSAGPVWGDVEVREKAVFLDWARSGAEKVESALSPATGIDGRVWEDM